MSEAQDLDILDNVLYDLMVMIRSLGGQIMQQTSHYLE